MSRTKAFWYSIAIGALVLALGISLPSEILLWPGMVFSVLFWPGGVHSNLGGISGAIVMFAVSWLGCWATWSAVGYALLRLAVRLTPKNSSKQTR